MITPPTSGTKLCNNLLPVLSFAVNRRNKDGLSNICRTCYRTEERSRKAKYRKPHRQFYPTGE